MTRPNAASGVSSLRVLFLNAATRPPLGADVWIHAEILRLLDRDAHDLHAACTFGPPGRPTPTYATMREIPDLELVDVRLGAERAGSSAAARARWVAGSLRAASGLARLARYVRRQRIEIVHAADRPRDAAIAVLVGRLTGAASILHVHVAYGEWMSPLLRWALRHADALVAVSSFVADTLVASGHDERRVFVVRNGIDVAAWVPGADREGARRELGVPDGAPMLLTVCRLFPAKGTTELVRALAIVHEQHPDARLVVAGEEMTAGFLAELQDLAEDLGVADRVTFTGRRDDIARLMAAADIYAMPSVDEPFGLVFTEAMAMQLPVVALDCGGAREIVVPGETGLLAEPGDVAGLANDLGALVADRERRRRFGQRGRQRVAQCFTSVRMATEVASVYRSVVRPQAVRLTSESGRIR